MFIVRNKYILIPTQYTCVCKNLKFREAILKFTINNVLSVVILSHFFHPIPV